MSGDFTGNFDAFLEKQSVATGGETATKTDGFAASFDKTLNDLGADPATAAKGNLFEANKGNPDEAAKAASAAQVTGLPAATVERNFSEVEAQIKATRQSQAMADNPQLARFYADRRNAVVAHDDFDRLDVLSKVWAAGARGSDDAVASNAAARAALPFVGGQMDTATSALVKRTQAETGAPFGGDDSSFYSFVRHAAGFVGGLVDQAGQSLKYAAAGATTGAAIGAIGGPAAPVTSTVGAGIGATVGFTAGMVVDGFKVGAGQLYLSLKDQKDANGAPLDPDTVKYAALGGGAVLGLLNMVGAGGVQKPMSAAASGAINLFVKDAVAQPTTQRAFVEFGKGLAKSAATGAAFGAANEGTSIAAETIAKTLSGGDWSTVLNDPEQRKAALDRLFASMSEMSVAFGAMHGAGGSVKLGSDLIRARQAEKDAGWIDRVNASIGETATAGRDRDAIQRFLGLQTDGTPVDNVFVPAAKVVELYQSYGLDPYRLDNDPILGFMPDLHDQLREAETTHGDVVIPAKDYFARLAGTEVFDKLKGDIRLRPDGMSFNEARDAHQEREANFQRTADEFREKMEAGDEAATPGERVYGDVFGKLRTAGYTNDAAAQQAAVYASHHQTRAARNPERFADAWASHESSGLKVEQVLPESIRYAQPDQLDVLLNSLRSGKDPVAPKDGRATLLESIAARGGMLDEGGELKSRDLDRWHLNEKGKPIKGRAPLIRDPGQEGQGAMFGASGGVKHSLDDTTLSAWENGYFPEHAERPEAGHLLAAIDEERKGRPRYSEDAPHDPRETFRASREELDGVLGRLGIDLKKLRNKDVRELLSAIGDGEGGYQQAVYHGSPHVFDKFTLDHIGTGEGAQAYGWGLYFAGNKAVAKYYREKLTPKGHGAVEVDGKTLVKNDGSAFIPHEEWADRVRMLLEDAVASGRSLKDEIAHQREAAKGDGFLKRTFGFRHSETLMTQLEEKGVKIAEAKKGRLYHVDIPEDGAYLHWDKPLSEQSPEVRVAIPGLIERYGGDLKKIISANGQLRDSVTGESVYKALTKALAPTVPPDPVGTPRGWGWAVRGDEGAKAASLALREVGIPGIQYLDANSRAKGEGSHNYVLFDDALATIKQYEQEHRGSIKFSDGAAIVSLFQGRDLSTFLHETGHLWLEELKADAAHPLASDAVKADFAAVLAHLGVKDGNIEVANHEQFARSFEAYLMEGKAPSDELRAPFQKFKAWLVAIYKNLASLHAPMSDTLRGVFDRLIATDDEIAAARAKQELNPIFASAEDAGMTKAEYAAYTAAIAKAHDAAEASALNKVMADVRQRRTKEWKEEETATREAVTRDTMREPGQATLHLLRTGKLWEGETPEPLQGAKLSRADLVALYGDEAVLKMLPFGIYKAEGGLGADGLADAMGFTSGRAMVDRLMGLEAQRRALREKGDKRSVARSIIEEETNRRMTERHGDALTDGSIQAEAMASVHNERQVSILGTEMRALAKQAGERPATVSDVRKWAADAIAGKVVKDAVSFGRYAKAERDAGLAAQRALLKGDKLAAFRAKQDQLVNHALYVEAKKAAHDRDVAVRMMDNYAGAKTIKSMAQDYLDQIHNLLEAVEFKDRPAAVERARNFAEWAVQQQADGVDVVAGQKLLTLADKQHYTEMTVSELRGLADTVRQVAHLGRLKKTLIVKAEKVEFDAKVDEAVAAVSALRQLPISDARNPRVAGSGLGEAGRALWERTKGGARSLDASLLKMEQVIDWLDEKGGGVKGVFNSVVFRPLSEAQNLENRLQARVTKRLLALNKAVPKEVSREWMTRREIPELIDSRTGKPSSMLKADVIAIAMNMGNASNKDKLLRGEKWDADAVKTVLDRSLTKADWEYVQGVWNTIDELWPHIEAMEKAVNGVAPDKVEALAVETPHGTMRGGYYPVVYDPARAGDVAQRAAKSADSLFENIYTRATTSRGFTNERVESYSRPILLSLDVIPRHVSEVIHDIAWREPIRQADKFLADKRIREAVEGALGREVYDQFRPWLQNMANEWVLDRRGLGFWDSVMKSARTSASVVGMGFRLTTMMAQTTGLSDSVEVIGAKWMAKGLASFVGDPANMKKTRDFVMAKSEEMANRMDSIERDVREAVRATLKNPGVVSEAGRVAASVRRFAYYGIGIMDMAVSLPTWMGAYEKGLHEGMTDADAAYSADKAIRSSQGAGSAKDLAGMQRSDEFHKLITMFYSYFNHMYNRQRDLVRSARDAKSAGDFAMVAARSFFLLVVPAIIGNYIGGQGPQDDENVAAWGARKVAANMFLGVPLLRDGVNYLERKYSGQYASYQATPATRGLDILGKALDDILRSTGVDDTPVSDEWIKHAIEAPGYVFGLPTGQAASTVQFLWDTSDDRQDPQSISDWFKGLTYGRYEDKKTGR